MYFLFRVCFHRRFWIACGVAAVLGMAAAPAAAQGFFSSPGDKGSPQPPPWQERGLRAALADPSPLLRSYAVEYLTFKNWAGLFLTAKDLEPLLQSPDENIKNRAAKALEQLSLKPAPGSEGPDTQKPNPFALESTEPVKKVPEKITPEVVSQLLTQLYAPSASVRADAVRALGRAGTLATPQIVSALVALLQDTDTRVVTSTVDALLGMGREEAACRKALLLMLKSPDWAARSDAMYLLTAAGSESPPEVIPLILPLLKDPVEKIQIGAAHCLQIMGPKLTPYIKDLLPMLKSEDWMVRCLVINTLGRIDPAAAPKALPALLPFLQKKNGELRDRAAIALGRMGPAAAPAARDLLAVLNNPDVEPERAELAQHAAAEALGQLGPGVVSSVGPALVQHLKDEDILLNYHILRAFECMGPAAAPVIIPAALPLLQSTDRIAKVWAGDTIELWGNFRRDPAWQCASLAGATTTAEADDLQSLRFSLYLWSGHDPDLLLSVRWLGRPAGDPMPPQGLSSEEQGAVLSVFLKLWDASVPYPALRREIAQRSADVARSITAAPDEKVAALLKRLDEQLKADAVAEPQEASAAAHSAVQSALARGAQKR
ncbi:MAG: HEAT repeat domain-containing protein [Prosthecobacter sp.]|uniref:HEAT repeat domain-containing protein n=1 Tax=Prosthecobacter sp. TaxID=1965333 RepID=UPI003BB054D4